MINSSYPGKPSTRAKLGAGLVPHLLGGKKNKAQKKKWLVSLSGRPILLREKGAGFIVLEGLDGSGKTTQAKLLANYLMEQNQKVLLTDEPTSDSVVGPLARQILSKKKKAHPATLQLLMSADRAEHIENEIKPALNKGIWVVSDRYYYSTFVYSSLSLSSEWIKALKELNYLFIAPNLTFVIDAEPETCLKRIDQQRLNQRSIFEKKEILIKIRRAYKDLAQELPNIKLINGERDIEAIAAEIRDYLEI